MEWKRSTRPPGVFGTLVRHFFSRFFDTESLSPQGEAEAGRGPDPRHPGRSRRLFRASVPPLTLTGWDLVSVRYLFVSFSMTVMGFLMVFEWDALFPDRRDYQVLTPQPLRLSTLFLAKAAALGHFPEHLSGGREFLQRPDVAGVDGGTNSFDILWAHLTAVAASGLFVALAAAALHGVLITVLRGWLYRRVSIAVQTLLMALLVMTCS